MLEGHSGSSVASSGGTGCAEILHTHPKSLLTVLPIPWHLHGFSQKSCVPLAGPEAPSSQHHLPCLEQQRGQSPILQNSRRGPEPALSLPTTLLHLPHTSQLLQRMRGGPTQPQLPPRGLGPILCAVQGHALREKAVCGDVIKAASLMHVCRA